MSTYVITNGNLYLSYVDWANHPAPKPITTTNLRDALEFIDDAAAMAKLVRLGWYGCGWTVEEVTTTWPHEAVEVGDGTQAQMAAEMSDTDLSEVHADLCHLIKRSLTKAQADLVRVTRTIVEDEIQRRVEVREAAGYVEALTAHGLANAAAKGLWAQTQDKLAAEREQGIMRDHLGRTYRRPQPSKFVNVSEDGDVTYPHVSEEDGGGVVHCLCGECVRLDWEALDDDDRPTLGEYRRYKRGAATR